MTERGARWQDPAIAPRRIVFRARSDWSRTILRPAPAFSQARRSGNPRWAFRGATASRFTAGATILRGRLCVTAMLGVCPASIIFSPAFSSSSAFCRLVTDTVNPEDFAPEP